MDYSGQDLRGRNFRGQTLKGANFSSADLRGANFTQSNLQGANFSYSRCGLSKGWIAGAVVFVSGITVFVISGNWLLILCASGIAIGVVAAVAARREPEASVVLVVVAVALMVSGGIASIVANLVATVILATPFTWLRVLIASAPFLLGVLLSVYLVLSGSRAGIIPESVERAKAGVLPVLSSILLELIRLTVATTGGTSFRRANLQFADFSNANLGFANLAEAQLTQTIWFKAKGLNHVRLKRSYLNDATIRRLVVTRNGRNRDFSYKNLQGLSLQGVDLSDARLVGANLNAANLQNANLSRAILKQTQLDGADLTGACLSGAYIEDWGITAETRFNDVRCEYVYMRVPTQENPDPLRKPDNRNEVFEEGDFAEFISPIVQTLDLYHNQGVDPRSIAISLKTLAEQHPDANLEFAAMERRGSGNLLLRFQTATTADRSALSAAYFETYNRVRSLSARETEALLEEKDSQIRRLENMVETALQRHTLHVERADFVSHNPGGISLSNTGSISGVVQAALGDQNQQSATVVIGDADAVPTQAEVLEALGQLRAIVQDAALPDASKEKATAYLGAAKVEAEEPEPDKHLIAKNLERVTQTLKTTDEAVTAGTGLLEKVVPLVKAIAPWLGVAATTLLTGL